MKVYVAGASAERDLVSSYMRKLEEKGIEIAYDWPKVMAAEMRRDNELGAKDAYEYGRKNLKAVAACDVFWLLAPQLPSTGCWVELGYALAARSDTIEPAIVVVSGNLLASPLFTVQSEFTYASHDAGFDAVVNMGRF